MIEAFEVLAGCAGRWSPYIESDEYQYDGETGQMLELDQVDSHSKTFIEILEDVFWADLWIQATRDSEQRGVVEVDL